MVMSDAQVLIYVYSSGEQRAAADYAGGAEQQRRRPAPSNGLPKGRLLLGSPRALPAAPRLRCSGCRWAVRHILTTNRAAVVWWT